MPSEAPPNPKEVLDRMGAWPDSIDDWKLGSAEKVAVAYLHRFSETLTWKP